MTETAIRFASFSHAAPGKKDNEDNFVVNLSVNGKGDKVFAIADGIGGHEGGKDASALAIDVVKKCVRLEGEISYDKIFSDVCIALAARSHGVDGLKNMGTTLTMCLFSMGKVYVGHVGDARVYHLRGSGIMRRTVDQTEVQELLNLGVLSKQTAKNYHRKNVLLSALTPKADYKLYTNSFDIIRGDRVLMMTDGVYKQIKLQEIRDISIAEKEIGSFTAALKNDVENKGPADDYTAVCIEII